MRIPYLNTETVNKFFKEGFLYDIRDIYRLKNFRARISALKGFGAKSCQNIIDGIDSRRKCSTADMIGALGIESIAQSTAKKILAIYNLDVLIDICYYHAIDKLMAIDGIGESKAEKFIQGVNANVDIIKYLRTELTLTDSETKQTITFTGFRDADFKEFLSTKGIDVKDSLTEDTEILVIDDLDEQRRLPEDEQSKKYKKALKKGIPVVDKLEYAERVGYKGIL
jgi:DNA ligase (NAD+)